MYGFIQKTKDFSFFGVVEWLVSCFFFYIFFFPLNSEGCQLNKFTCLLIGGNVLFCLCCRCVSIFIFYLFFPFQVWLIC